jgi:hypothetical protein
LFAILTSYDIECAQPIDDYGRGHRKRARGEIARHFRDYDPFEIQDQTAVIENRLDLGAHRGGDVRLREGMRNSPAEKCVASEAVDFRADLVDADFARLLRLIHLSDIACGLLWRTSGYSCELELNNTTGRARKCSR